MGDSCLSCVRRPKIVYILCDFSRVFHGSLPSCTLWEGSKEHTTTAPPWEAREGHTGPKAALCGPVCGVFASGGGTTRPRPFRGDLGPTGPSLAEGKETASSPGWGRSWGCDSQAGERSGVAGASPAGSPRPAEPVVAGFLPSSTTQTIRGRLGGLGVTTGVRNTKFPGGKPFFRVSPPGSTKG